MNRRFLLQAFASVAALGTTGLGHAQGPGKAKTLQLSGQTLDAKPYDLGQDHGKAILVFFWSTDCAVCRDKMPELRTNYSAWRDKGFQLVAVSLDKNLADVQAYDRILSHTVPMKQQFPSLWRADPAHRDSFGAVTKAPTSFLLNRQGQLEKEIRGRIPAELWDDIAELVLT
ncbi:MAG: TlpA disulfide reductase family protein [Burkholderiales bacterium]